MGRKRMASRRSFPDNLYVNADGYFYYRNPLNGQRKGIGSDKTKAFSEARQANALIANMKPSTLIEWVTGTESETFKSWIPKYEVLWIEQAKPVESTKRMAKRILLRFAEVEFAWMPLADITTAHIANYMDTILKESGPGAAQNLRSRLSDVFRMAITRGLLTAGANPVSETYKSKHVTLRERMSIDQFYMIRGHAPVWLANAMNLALVTGQRREDIVNMQFTDFDDGNLQVVQGKGQGRMKIKIAGSLRLNAFDKSVEDVIRQCRDSTVSKHMVHFIQKSIKNEPGGQVMPDTVSKVFNMAVKSAGIKAADGRTPPSFHEIRSLCERMYRMEKGADFAQKILGHLRPDMTSEYDNLRGSGWVEVG